MKKASDQTVAKQGLTRFWRAAALKPAKPLKIAFPCHTTPQSKHLTPHKNLQDYCGPGSNAFETESNHQKLFQNPYKSIQVTPSELTSLQIHFFCNQPKTNLIKKNIFKKISLKKTSKQPHKHFWLKKIKEKLPEKKNNNKNGFFYKKKSPALPRCSALVTSFSDFSRVMKRCTVSFSSCGKAKMWHSWLIKQSN